MPRITAHLGGWPRAWVLVEGWELDVTLTSRGYARSHTDPGELPDFRLSEAIAPEDGGELCHTSEILAELGVTEDQIAEALWDALREDADRDEAR